MPSKKTETLRLNLSKMEEFLNNIDSAVQQQFNSLSPQAIIDSIMKDFKDQRAAVIYKLMGFERTYGKEWSVDHCNGRAGNSPIGDWIKDQFEVDVKPVIKEMIAEILNEDFKKDVGEAIKKQISEQLRYETRSFGNKVIQEYIADVAKEQAEELKEFVKQYMLKKNDLVEK